MKKFLFVLLLSIIFGNVFSDKGTRAKMTRAMKTMKNLEVHKEKLIQRKLEGTDELTDMESGESSNATTSETNSSSVINPTDEVETETEINKTSSAIQIKKFHDYRREEYKFFYSVFFYFLNRPIIRIVAIRIRIVYRSRLRGLEDTVTTESVPSNCVIKKEFEEKVGTTNENGENVDYDCEAPTNITAEIGNATVDTKYPLDLGNETVDFENINFDEDAAKEALNLVDITDYTKVGTLDNSVVEFLKNSFRINGTATPDNLLKGKKTIDMEFIHYTSPTDYEKKNVTCSITEIDSKTYKYTLDCPSSLRSYVSNITLAKSYDDNIFVKINMNQTETGELISTEGGNRIYRKSSSGLSRGAIAGIVIACVVAIIAASILAIMLRKPKPPIDSTTIAGLKTAENF